MGHLIVLTAPALRGLSDAEIAGAELSGRPRRLGPEAAEIPVATMPDLAALRTRLAGIDVNAVPAANRRKRILIADMDSTMIPVECIDEVADFAGVRPQVSAITERAMRGEPRLRMDPVFTRLRPLHCGVRVWGAEGGAVSVRYVLSIEGRDQVEKGLLETRPSGTGSLLASASWPPGALAPGLEQPLHHWDPSIAPSGMMIYSGRLWPEWQGDIFVGSLKFDFLSRLEGDASGVAEAERLFEGDYIRIRDVREAPDGAIWFLAETDGAAYRMAQVPGS